MREGGAIVAACNTPLEQRLQRLPHFGLEVSRMHRKETGIGKLNRNGTFLLAMSAALALSIGAGVVTMTAFVLLV
jgi:hypothetical protein